MKSIKIVGFIAFLKLIVILKNAICILKSNNNNHNAFDSFIPYPLVT